MQVSITYQYTPILSFFFPSGIPIHSYGGDAHPMKTLRTRGQSLVEIAILLPLLLLIFMLMLDLGRAVYYYSVIHNAAREGARYGVIHPDDDSAGIQTRRPAIWSLA